MASYIISLQKMLDCKIEKCNNLLEIDRKLFCILSSSLPRRLNFTFEFVKLFKMFVLESEELVDAGRQDGQQVSVGVIVQQIHQVVQRGRELLFDGRVQRLLLQVVEQVNNDVGCSTTIPQLLRVDH